MRGDAGIGYDMIVGRDLMLHLGLKNYFGCQIMEWKQTIIPMKETGNLLGQPDLTKHKIREMVIQAEEPAYTI